MNQGVKITAYVLGGASIVLLSNEIVKFFNSGIGFLTTKRKMGKYVGKSDKGVSTPYTKENIKDFLESWETFGDDYTKEWYKAVWKSENGKPTPYFFIGSKRHKTKGGTAG